MSQPQQPFVNSAAAEMAVFTDRPARCLRLPDGHIDFDNPCNVVVRRVAANLDTPTAECRLSVRCAYGGARVFRTDDGRYVVNDSGYLLLNLGSRVRSHLQDRAPVEMLNVTFQPEFADSVLASLVTPEDRLLDDPSVRSTQPVRFVEMSYLHDNVVSPVLNSIRHRAATGNLPTGWLEESLHVLAERLLQRHRGVVAEVNRLSASRRSTRVETFRRLSLARDFLDASFAQPIRLEDAAAVACLSPHHFLRVFRQAFGATPHRYLVSRRLAVSHRLLATTDLSVTDVCFAVGFESLGSFSSLFKARFGSPPSYVRSDRCPQDDPAALHFAASPSGPA